MHPSHHQKRRQTGAMALQKQYHPNPEVCYVYTVSYPGRSEVTAVVVNHQCNAVPSCSVNTSRPDMGAVAIAKEMAMGRSGHRTRASITISGSKTALCNYARGMVSTEAAHMLPTRSETTARQGCLVWTPGNSFAPGSEMAQEAARGFYNQAHPESKEMPSV
ncbi:hypothetical protein HPB48_019519 [Haemaphysalis longicornis]|uniref:Uncharacterized protein n=1 Tax=Haemaphysalis longicornis TaxID=44386 RepID=A0A9J6GLQ2_HAELO|nr:hypothetical protein HPB48_019519 [Haemaphysalis longicornis]